MGFDIRPRIRRAFRLALRRRDLTDAEIPFALVGGYASWARGAPEPSHDADFAIKEEDVERAKAAIAAKGLEVSDPAENWLFKAFHHGQLVDVLFRMVGEPVTEELLARADQLEVLAVRMPVLAATDIVSAKMRVLGEHACDFGRLLAIVRALREQIDWDVIRHDVRDHPYAKAFLYLADELGITDVQRAADVDVEPGRAAAPTGSDAG